MCQLLSISPFTRQPGIGSKVSALIVMNVLSPVFVDAELIEGFGITSVSLCWKRTTKPWPKTKAERLCTEYTLVTVWVPWWHFHALTHVSAARVPQLMWIYCKYLDLNKYTRREKLKRLNSRCVAGREGVTEDPLWSAHRNSKSCVETTCSQSL